MSKTAPAKMRVSERQRKALARLAASQDHCMSMDRILAQQLARKNLVRITEHVYERSEWGKVVARLPIVQLLVKP